MADFLYWVAVAVVGGVILAGLSFGFRWLLIEENREWLRQRFCQHEWETIDKGWGTSVVYVTPYDEECRRCGLQRVRPE